MHLAEREKQFAWGTGCLKELKDDIGIWKVRGRTIPTFLRQQKT